MRTHSLASRTRAFTVVEVTVTMAIVAVLLALVIPRFAAQRDQAAVAAAAGDLGSIFSNARQTAVSRRTAVAIVLDSAAGAVEVRARGQRIIRRSFRGAYGISLGANRDSAVYDPRGLGFGASNLSITLRRGAIVDTLTMSRLGRVRW
jgi:prepilin-type N-terminal cleavage/methylation domain-containing protein